MPNKTDVYLLRITVGHCAETLCCTALQGNNRPLKLHALFL